MRPKFRRTVRLFPGDEARAVNALIRKFVEDGYKRIRIGNPERCWGEFYITVIGLA